MSGDRDRVIMAEMIARCWQDAAFAEEFSKDPVKKLKEAGMQIPESKKVKVFRSDSQVIYMGLSHSMTTEDYTRFAKTQFEALLPLSEGREIRLVQSTPDYMPIVIPAPPQSFQAGTLSEAELASVAGGGGYLVEAVNVASTANAVAEANGAVYANVAGATEAVGVAEAVAAAVIAVVLI
jgi:hypothetical protein